MTKGYDLDHYEKLIAEQAERFPPITLPPEYAEFIEGNTVMLLIKLARYKFAASMLRATDDVLEAGSGAGLGSIFLAQYAKHVTGIEIKPREYESARAINRRANVMFKLQSIFDYDPARRHDAVVSLDVIEHLNEADGDRFVGQLAKLCQPTGLVIIGTPSIHSYPHQGKYSQAAHIKCYDRPELVALMDRYFERTLTFSMNDEVVHTGHPKMAWYYFAIGFMPKHS